MVAARQLRMFGHSMSIPRVAAPEATANKPSDGTASRYFSLVAGRPALDQ
jgi:hypothetical protein